MTRSGHPIPGTETRTPSSERESEGQFVGVRTAASTTIVSVLLLAGCAVGTRSFRYEPPPTVGGADREYCHALASTSAEKTYARYAAMMGIDPLGRTSGTTFGGPALAEHAWAERDAAYEGEMRACLRLKGYAE
jgi:hypothetical protein